MLSGERGGARLLFLVPRRARLRTDLGRMLLAPREPPFGTHAARGKVMMAGGRGVLRSTYVVPALCRRGQNPQEPLGLRTGSLGLPLDRHRFSVSFLRFSFPFLGDL